MEPDAKRMNPVQYAEQVLAVHVPWEEAQRHLDLHADASEHVDLTRREIRAVKANIEDRKAEVTAEAPSTRGYPEGVQARRDFTKLLLASDDKLTSMEKHLDNLHSMLDDYQSAVKHHELALYAVTARMNELGGLLQFYSVAKAAETKVALSGE